MRREWLQRWWCKKYNRPRKDPLLAEYTLEELMIEYLEDLIELEPHEEFPQDVQGSGRYVHRTGDAVFDSWQEKAAAGEHIDFSEAFTTKEARDAFERVKERSRKRAAPAAARTPEPEMPPDIHDDYTGGG